MDTFMVNGNKMTADEVRAKFYNVFGLDDESDNNKYLELCASIEAWVIGVGVKGMAKALRWHFKTHSHDFELMRKEYKE